MRLRPCGARSPLLRSKVQRSGGCRVQLFRAEGITGGDVREADEGMHQGELARMIELEAGNAFAIRQARGFGELAQLSAVDERFRDVLLEGEIAVDDCRYRLA